MTATSVFTRKADIRQCRWHVGFGPKKPTSTFGNEEAATEAAYDGPLAQLLRPSTAYVRNVAYLSPILFADLKSGEL
jgi:hypothetical protein